VAAENPPAVAVMRPAPLSKTPAISRFQGEQGHAATFSRKKTGNCGSFGPDGTRRKVVQPDEVMSCCAPAGLRVGGGLAKEAVSPRSKSRDPRTPLSPAKGAARPTPPHQPKVRREDAKSVQPDGVMSYCAPVGLRVWGVGKQAVRPGSKSRPPNGPPGSHQLRAMPRSVMTHTGTTYR
jgi:hypothetical protein